MTCAAALESGFLAEDAAARRMRRSAECPMSVRREDRRQTEGYILISLLSNPTTLNLPKFREKIRKDFTTQYSCPEEKALIVLKSVIPK